ncbi:probable ATP-dependent RNA helicase DHX35 [Ruditapes philippinarum]|uniref:probable ATP-dependent RNA helicase DHX35 n=1 Tax=Ruditapes philippinarum TaxID=129788 RepID=UPI00295BFE52|nr:probable ATP-dependent RNA helicase DHX35 [Ruditapes philippinarum]
MIKKPKFWKPGETAPGQSLEEERKSGKETDSQVAVYNPNVSLSIEQQRQKLPIFKVRNHILYLVEKYQTVVIVGSTGCGKSTQIPQYLLEAGWCKEGHLIGVTQPRRVAAITVASRIAEERGTLLGGEIGYLIRFDDCCDETTSVKCMTDGMLIREIMKDPLLSRYSVLLLDEVHERTLYTDIILGLIRKIQQKREDLHVIVASATLDAEEIKDFFNRNETDDKSLDTAAILSIEGRAFPVDIHYTIDPVPDYIKATVDTIVKLHRNEKPGDVLAFLTGMDEVGTVTRMLIEEAKQLLKKPDAMRMKIVPMHGSLPAAEQMKAFERTPKNCRKIVVATNIAETSITINGIVYIVDCGFVKIRTYHPKTGIESLVIVPVSQASANQRAGRAGRVRAGKAYRLFTEADYDKLPEATVPEMQRSDLAPVILQLKALGIANVLRFHFLSAPPAQNMVRGLELLYALGALDDNGNLTSPLGLRMAEFPLTPMFSKMLLVSGEFGCSEEAVIIAAMSQIQNVFVSPSGQKHTANRIRRKFSVEEGDHVSLVNVYRAFIKYDKSAKWCHENLLNFKGLVRATEIREQLLRMIKRFNIPVISCEGRWTINDTSPQGFKTFS